MWKIAAAHFAQLLKHGVTTPSQFRSVEGGHECEAMLSKGLIRLIQTFLSDHRLRKLDICYKKSGCSVTEKTVELRLEACSLTGIEERVRATVNEAVAGFEFSIGPGETLTEAHDVQSFVRSGRETLKITALNRQKGFSKYTQFHEAFALCGERVTLLEEVIVDLMIEA